MTDLGPEWQPDIDGVPSRRAARLILFDSTGHVLLIKGHDTHDLDHQWWFTVGGGLEPGESPVEGAIREAREETGLDIQPGVVVGPVMHRKAEFRFRNVVARQEEDFFLAYMNQPRPALDTNGLTDLENQTLDEFRWLTPDQVDVLARKETVYPLVLPELLHRWYREWDGEFVELGEEEDGPHE